MIPLDLDIVSVYCALASDESEPAEYSTTSCLRNALAGLALSKPFDVMPWKVILGINGMDGRSISDTLCDPEHVESLPALSVDEPTVSMTFIVNDSPFAGLEGKYVTTRNIRDRLEQELISDPKELAEHLMLVDLGRNDVGRIATTGSVKLTSKMQVERYSHVMQWRMWLALAAHSCATPQAQANMA